MRSTTTREPEWDEQDQAWMLALAHYRDGLCPCGCGHPQADTTAQEGTVRWRVPPPVRCLARDALIQQQETSNRPRPGALLWRVERAG